YLTLSHCWGGGNNFKLQAGNLKHLKSEIPLDQLPRTFRDAMVITKVLGYRYLWIDSLCIIQDSEEDWAQEAGRMAQVYGNAILNLAA
ncbi:heterokaryon incompatibility, partial [Tricladium varicosporioides]